MGFGPSSAGPSDADLQSWGVQSGPNNPYGVVGAGPSDADMQRWGITSGPNNPYQTSPSIWDKIQKMIGSGDLQKDLGALGGTKAPSTIPATATTLPGAGPLTGGLIGGLGGGMSGWAASTPSSNAAAASNPLLLFQQLLSGPMRR